MEDKIKNKAFKWVKEEIEGLEYQVRSLMKEMLDLELRFESITVFHENFEMGYEDRCLSNYDRDLEKLEKAYYKVMEFVDQSPVQITYLRILKSLAGYKLGCLYTVREMYDKALPLLEETVEEMEKHQLIPVMRYEYADACLKEGKCRIEKRDKVDKIIRCYKNAEQEINGEDEPDEFYASIKLLVRKEDTNKWELLKTDLELSWAVLYLDLYDRTEDKRAENLKNARLHLRKMHKILFGEKNSSAEPSLSFCKKKMEQWKKEIEEGEQSKTGRRESAREKEAHEKVWAAKRDRKMLLAYLATQGACYLKMAGDGNEPDKVESYIHSMKCYLSAYYCDLSNTIAMGNICYLSLLNSNASETGKSFWEGMKEDGDIRKLSGRFKERLCEDIESKIRFKTEQLLVRGCVKRVKHMIKRAWEFHQWEECQTLEEEPDKHAIKIKIRNSLLIRTAVEEVSGLLDEIINRQLCLAEMGIRSLRIVLRLLDSNLEWLEEYIDGFFNSLWSINPYIGEQEHKHEKQPDGKARLKDWIYHGIENSLSVPFYTIQEKNNGGKCRTELINGIKTRAEVLFSKTPGEERQTGGFGRWKCIGKEAEEEGELQNQQMEAEIMEEAFSPAQREPGNFTYPAPDLLDLLDKGVMEPASLYRAILTVLSDILRIENSNMYALNLKTCILKLLKQNPDRQAFDDSYKVYTNLRQSTLKKCFLNLDSKAHGEPCTLYCRERLKQTFILFYNEVASFMNGFIRRNDKKGNVITVGHYTMLKTLPLLIKKGEETHFRLYNMEHLNDPEEGKILIKLLKAKGPGEQNGMLQEIIEKYESDSFENSGVYIGSFTGRLDNLNMWFQYGDGGNGCCMVVDADSTFDKDVNITLSHMYQSDSGEYFESLDSRYALYEVAYYPWGMQEGRAGGDETKKKVDDFAGRVCFWIERIEKQARELETAAHLKKDELEELDLEIQKTVMLILDQVRFLIKSRHYEEEKEYRVIKHSNSPECDPNGRDVPRLYIEMKKPIVYSEVCLGPKVENPASIAAYILSIQPGRDMRKSIGVKKSSIKIR